jgi:hypothetical protein
VIFASAHTAQVNYDRDQQNQQINSRYGLVCVHHPGIYQCCERQKQESDQRHKQSVVRMLQVIREEEQQGKRDARKRKKYNHQQTGHDVLLPKYTISTSLATAK